MDQEQYLGLVKEAAATVCNSQPGRVLLEYLAFRFYVGSTTFVPGDPEQSNINEGNRQAVLHIMDLAGLTKMEDIVSCLKKPIPEKPEAKS